MKKKVIIFILFFLLLDLISKFFAVRYLTLNESISIIPNFFSLTLLKNTGASFSFLQNSRWMLIFLSILFLIIIVIFYKKFKSNKRNEIAFSLIIGGLIGNLFDRVVKGYVIDFLSFKIFGYDFPVFNIADICITIGVALLIISIIIGDDKNETSSRKK